MGKKIFIVDDDAMYTMFMEDHLKSKGHSDIGSFSTGESFLDNFQDDVDVILLDYNLDADVPGAMNGSEVLEKIRMQNTKVHVIMISAQEAYSRQNAGSDAALHYVVKGSTSFAEIDKILERV